MAPDSVDASVVDGRPQAAGPARSGEPVAVHPVEDRKAEAVARHEGPEGVERRGAEEEVAAVPRGGGVGAQREVDHLVARLEAAAAAVGDADPLRRVAARPVAAGGVRGAREGAEAPQLRARRRHAAQPRRARHPRVAAAGRVDAARSERAVAAGVGPDAVVGNTRPGKRAAGSAHVTAPPGAVLAVGVGEAGARGRRRPRGPRRVGSRRGRRSGRSGRRSPSSGTRPRGGCPSGRTRPRRPGCTPGCPAASSRQVAGTAASQRVPTTAQARRHSRRPGARIGSTATQTLPSSPHSASARQGRQVRGGAAVISVGGASTGVEASSEGASTEGVSMGGASTAASDGGAAGGEESSQAKAEATRRPRRIGRIGEAAKVAARRRRDIECPAPRSGLNPPRPRNTAWR